MLERDVTLPIMNTKCTSQQSIAVRLIQPATCDDIRHSPEGRSGLLCRRCQNPHARLRGEPHLALVGESPRLLQKPTLIRINKVCLALNTIWSIDSPTGIAVALKLKSESIVNSSLHPQNTDLSGSLRWRHVTLDD